MPNATTNLRKFGPKQATHPSIGNSCPACNQEFREGDYTTLVAYGPGNDAEAQQRARTGQPYNAIAAEVHWACATGNLE